MSKLVDEHLKLGGVVVGAALGPLADAFGTFKDIGPAMGGQMLFFESFEEHFNRGWGAV